MKSCPSGELLIHALGFKAMTYANKLQILKWKQAATLCCLLYTIAVWVLPVLMLPFVKVHPYVHERSVLQRLPFSVAGSIIVIATLIGMSKEKLFTAPQAINFKMKITHWCPVFAGLAMFTYAGAELSPNLFGLVTKLLRHESHTVQVMIESVSYSGSRSKSVTLQCSDPVTSEPRYPVLSKQLFDYPRIRRGDMLELKEQRSILGTYIQGISHQQCSQNSCSKNVYQFHQQPPVSARIRRS